MQKTEQQHLLPPEPEAEADPEPSLPLEAGEPFRDPGTAQW